MTFEQYKEQYERIYTELRDAILAIESSKDKRVACDMAKRISQKAKADVGQLLQQVEQQALTINRQTLTIRALES